MTRAHYLSPSSCDRVNSYGSFHAGADTLEVFAGSEPGTPQERNSPSVRRDGEKSYTNASQAMICSLNNVFHVTGKFIISLAWLDVSYRGASEMHDKQRTDRLARSGRSIAPKQDRSLWSPLTPNRCGGR